MFEKQRIFLLKTLESAREKVGWETLDYDPDEKMVFDRMKELEKMIQKMSEEDIDEKNTWEWIREDEDDSCIPAGYPKCPRHGIWLSIFGCLACNDN